MNHSLIPRLIWKDIEMTWPFPVVATVAGCGALALFYFGSNALALAGIVAFFVVLVILGTMPMQLIVNERKKQTLAFVMSLPVSAGQYGTAKLASSLGMFVVPWLMLIGIAFSLVVGRSDTPNGIIPLALVLVLLPLIGFLLTTSVAIVSESETRSIITMAAVNISYSFVWLVVTAFPGMTRDAANAVPVWNETILSVLAGEVGLVAIVLALTLYLQSRKRDFV